MTEQTFGNFLKLKFHLWRGRKLPEMPSQADFAVFLGVPTTNLSTWMNDQKKPGPEYVDIIADKMARARLAKRTEVYIAAGVPPRMPADKKFSLIALVWDIMPDQVRNEWYEVARNIASEQQQESEHNSGERSA
jgi:hypothetical protein